MERPPKASPFNWIYFFYVLLIQVFLKQEVSVGILLPFINKSSKEETRLPVGLE